MVSKIVVPVPEAENISIIKPKTKQEDYQSELSENRKRRVAAYARVSTEKDEQFSSYEAQVDYYTNFIKSHKEWTFVKVYTDEGITGTNTKKRKAFQKMVKDSLNGKIDLIVTKSVSRFARNTIDRLPTMRKLKEKGVKIFFEKENIWTFEVKGELLITILSSLAKEESRSISENVTWGMRESMRKGNAWVPYKVFLGYEKDSNGAMVINPEQSILVRRIYGMFFQGMSPYSIAKIFEAEGQEFSEGNRKWYGSTLTSILKNEKYKGDALRQKTYSVNYLTKERAKNNGELQQYYIHNHHEPVIGSELFDMVQRQFEHRNPEIKLQNGPYIFSKKTRCADCGSWYSKTIWFPNTGHERVVWRCIKKYRMDKEKCAPPAVIEDVLKEKFIIAVNRLLKDKNNQAKTIKQINDEMYTIRGLEAEKKDLLREISLVKSRLKKQKEQSKDYLSSRLVLAENRLCEVNEEIWSQNGKRNEIVKRIEKLFKEKSTSKFDENIWLVLADHITNYSHTKAEVTFRCGTRILV